MEVYTTLSLTSAQDGVGGESHGPAALPPGKRAGTYCVGGWVGPKAGLDGCGKSRLQRPGRSEWKLRASKSDTSQ